MKDCPDCEAREREASQREERDELFSSFYVFWCVGSLVLCYALTLLGRTFGCQDNRWAVFVGLAGGAAIGWWLAKRERKLKADLQRRR